MIREADGTVHGRRLEQPLSLVPVPGGWVGLRTDRAWFIASDGTWTDLGEPGPARDPRPGDVVLPYAAPTLFSPDDHSWSYLLADGAAYVAPDGRVVSCRPEGDQLLVTADGATPTHGRGTACLLVGQGDHVTMAGTRDGEGGGVWLYSLLGSHDGGATWRDGRIPSDLDLASVTVGEDGTSYVTGTDGRLFVTLADGDISEPTGEYGVVVAAGDRVYSLSYARDHGPLRYSDDHGTHLERNHVARTGVAPERVTHGHCPHARRRTRHPAPPAGERRARRLGAVPGPAVAAVDDRAGPVLDGRRPRLHARLHPGRLGVRQGVGLRGGGGGPVRRQHRAAQRG